jgi:hypothetical protein
LLGLLLAATEQWKAAGEILERGAELGEEGEEQGDEKEDREGGEEDGEEDGKDDGEYGKDGDQSACSSIGGETLEADRQTLRRPPSVLLHGDDKVDLKAPDHRAANGNGIPNTKPKSNETDSRPPPLYLLENDATHIPAAASLLMPTPDHDLPSKQDVFEYALQLRMTQAALTEVVEGAEGAELKWVNIFSWHAEKRGAGGGGTFLFCLWDLRRHFLFSSYYRSHTSALDGWEQVITRQIGVFCCDAAFDINRSPYARAGTRSRGERGFEQSSTHPHYHIACTPRHRAFRANVLRKI